MSTQDTQLLSSIKDLLAKIVDNMHPQEPIGIIGGNIQAALPYLDGWTYVLDAPPVPIPITRGGARVQMFPDWTDEEGWIVGGQIEFDDPDGHMSMTIDNLHIDASPRIMAQATESIFGIITIRANIYNPILRAFGFSAGFTIPAPYKSRVRFEAYLGNESPNATANVTLFGLAKIKINDRKAFFASLKRFAYQQSNGTRQAVTREL